MTTFAKRRIYNVAIVLAVSLTSLLVYTSYSLSLQNTSFGTGWLLLMLIVALTLLNARKKLPAVPLPSSALWLQVHIYVGLFTVVLFGVHVEFRLPNGWLEGILALLFLAVLVSGVIGLALSRIIPARLRTRGELVIFERHPVYLRRIREELADLVSGKTESTSLSEYYVGRLIAFFAKPRHFRWHLVQSHRPLYNLLNELEALDRYLSVEQRTVKESIGALIRTKDDLDYHHAHQAVLKYWLFVHIPLSYSLLIVAGVHGAIAHAFWG